MPRKIKVPKELSKAVVEKKKVVPKPKVEKKKAVPKEKVEKKKAVPKEKVEKKKAVPKDKVEKKKAVPKAKVEKKKAVPNEKVEKKKEIPKAKVEKKAATKAKLVKKKAVPKDKVEKKKAVSKDKVEKKKAVPKEKVEKKVAPKAKLVKKKAIPKEKVKKKKAVPKVARGGKLKENTRRREFTQSDILPQEFTQSDILPQKIIQSDNLPPEFTPSNKQPPKSSSPIKTLYTQTPSKEYPEIADNGTFVSISEFDKVLNMLNEEEILKTLKTHKIDKFKHQENILNKEEFYELLKDPSEEDVKKGLGLSLQGGKKTIKHIRKPKYEKKYRGGNITDKLSKLKEMISTHVFGTRIIIPDEDYRHISEETKTFIEGIKTTAKSSIVERQLESDKQILLLDMFVRAINSEEKIDRLAKSFRAMKIIDYAYNNREILKTFKNKHASQDLKSIEYVNREIFNKLFRPNEKLYIYGMQLPHQFDRVRLLGTIYKLHNKQIYSIVDLQDCNGGLDGDHPRLAYGVGCNPFDRDCEFDLWTIALTSIDSNISSIPDNAKYYSIEYTDMSAGSLKIWSEISQIRRTNDKKNKTVIHCLAGAGRTGCVMLYLLMRDLSLFYIGNDSTSNEYIKYLKDKIKLPFFGLANIKKFIEDELFCYFQIQDDNEVDNNKASVKNMLSELFDTSDNLTISGKRASLFRKRLNYIIVFISKHFSITEFVTYHDHKFKIGISSSVSELVKMPDLVSPTNLDYEFIKPCKQTITSWDNYEIEEFMEKPEDIKYKEVMSWIN